MRIESHGPSVVRSVKQRDLLNVWLRLVARHGRTPRLADYQPDRIEDEKPDLVWYDVTYDNDEPRFRITYHGRRLAAVYGIDGNGLMLEEVIGPVLAPTAMPIYRASAMSARPVYSIHTVSDVHGREVAYERLLLPFASDDRIDRLIASCKAISMEGAFEQQNLLSAATGEPAYTMIALIDRDAAPWTALDTAGDDVVELD